MLHGRRGGSSTSFTPREASLVLHRSLRQCASVTSLGGNHFIAALPDTIRLEAESIADSIREGFLTRTAGTLPVFDVVTGFATFPEEGRTDSDLIRAACAAARRQRLQVGVKPIPGAG